MERGAGYGKGDAALALIVADATPGARDAEAAIALTGGSFRGHIGWRDAAAGRFDHAGAVELISMEAQGVAPDDIDAALPALAALHEATGARIVVALDSEQIDLIAPPLLGGGVELLCNPSVADRVSAFALALAHTPTQRVRDRGGDDDSEQLRKLNEEVARISRVLAQLAKEEERAAPPNRPPAYDPTPPAPATSASVTASDVRKMIRARRLRDQYIAPALFEEPAWDMMLDLYAAHLENVQVSVSSLCIAAAVAPTTALRWIARMTETGLFVRHPDPFDKRRAFLTLSDGTRVKMDRYFVALRQGALDTF